MIGSLAPRMAVFRRSAPAVRHGARALGRASTCRRTSITADVDRTCRTLVRALGDAGWLKAVVPAAYGGLSERLDVRTLCLAREILAWHDSLADFAFAMQGLGTGSISLFGSDALKAKYLPPVRDGRHIAAFALSEPAAGSDVSALATTATSRRPGHVRIDGIKTWISNGGIADHYVVFARTGEAPGAKGLSAFVVDADTPGLSVVERIDVIAPHPLATLRFAGLPGAADEPAGRARRRLQGGDGDARHLPFDRRRPPRLGLARRALRRGGRACGHAQAVRRAARRSADDAGVARRQRGRGRRRGLLVYRAAWTKDQGAARITRESSIAKMFATEMAQRVIDRAVQIFGGNGVRVGIKVEALYREIRALRIYEGATEVQKVIVARELLKARAAACADASRARGADMITLTVADRVATLR